MTEQEIKEIKENYEGYKEGKAFWKYHGKHIPLSFKSSRGEMIACKVCGVILLDGDYDGIPEDSGRTIESLIYGPSEMEGRSSVYKTF